MIKVLTILGTRPEAIKMAPVIKEMQKCPEKVACEICVTGQHREMLDQALGLFGIKPDHDIDIMEPDQSLSGLTANMLARLDPVVKKSKPDWIVAQGDTTTAFVAALVAYYNKIPFGHIEAGLRTGDKYRPFPEEINRRLADVIADLLFAPTQTARKALISEGVPEKNIYVTGNTVIDALMDVAAMGYDPKSGVLAGIPDDARVVLVTAHRRESFGGPLLELCSAIRELAGFFADKKVYFVYPVHLNPNVRQPVRRILSDLPNVCLTDPLDYQAMVNLMKRAEIILTDSGGIQEEAPAFGVPVLILRDTTERPEGVEAGVAKLVGTRKETIIKETAKLLTDPVARSNMSHRVNPYGDGKAAGRIVTILLERSKS